MHFIYSLLDSTWSTSYAWCLNIFRSLLRFRRYKQILVEVGIFQGGGCIIPSANFRWKGTSPTNLCWYQKTSDYPFMWYQIIGSMFFRFVTMVPRWIIVTKRVCDGQTDRRTELRSQDHASMAWYKMPNCVTT